MFRIFAYKKGFNTMKKSKSILLVLSSALLLAGCINIPLGKECPTCPQCNQQSTYTLAPKPFMDKAQTFVKEKFDAMYEMVDENAHKVIKELYEETLKKLSEQEGFNDEEEAQEYVEVLIEEFSAPTLVDIAIRYYSDIILDILSKTNVNETSILLEIKDCKFWELRNVCEQEGFYATLSIVDEIQKQINGFWEIYPQFAPVDPDEPGSSYLRYKQEITDFAYYLVSQAYEFVDINEILTSDKMRLEDFDEVKSGDEAKALTKEIKDDLYDYVFNLFKTRLCGALTNFVEEVAETLKAESVCVKLLSYLSDDKKTIMAEQSFEDARDFYETCYDTYDSEIGFELRKYYRGILEQIHTDFVEMCDGDKSLSDLIDAAFKEAYDEINQNSSDLRDMTKEMEEVISSFETYCLTVLG